MIPDPKAHQVAAYWPDVERLIMTKKRGDDLTRQEISAASHGVEPSRFEERIRRWFRHQGIHLIAISGVGWHVATEEEQVKACAEGHRKRAKTHTKLSLHAAGSVDDSQLSPEARRLRDLYVRHAGAQLAAEKATDQERRLVLGMPPVRPQLKPVK